MFKPLFTATAAVLVLAIVPVKAQADETERRVSFADLDLATPDGQATLDRRLTIAVKHVCTVRGRVDLAMTMRSNKCRRDTATLARSLAQDAIGRSRATMAMRNR